MVLTEKTSAQREIIMRIREELARRRMSRAALADAAKISLSSLEKSLSGQRPFTDHTLVRLEQVLELRLPRGEIPAAGMAPEHMGSYARAAIHWIEGCYQTLRPATSDAAAVYAYETRIFWEPGQGHLHFLEARRADKAYAQQGYVSLPHQSGHIYLVTNRHGQHRMAILKREAMTGELYGLQLTLQQGRGAQLLPVAMPLVLVPIEDFAPKKPAFGTITAEHEDHAEMKAKLEKCTRDGFAMMLGRG
jgi:transcriptional regulator with XRE-family HTH domain